MIEAAHQRARMALERRRSDALWREVAEQIGYSNATSAISQCRRLLGTIT